MSDLPPAPIEPTYQGPVQGPAIDYRSMWSQMTPPDPEAAPPAGDHRAALEALGAVPGPPPPPTEGPPPPKDVPSALRTALNLDVGSRLTQLEQYQQITMDPATAPAAVEQISEAAIGRFAELAPKLKGERLEGAAKAFRDLEAGQAIDLTDQDALAGVVTELEDRLGIPSGPDWGITAVEETDAGLYAEVQVPPDRITPAVIRGAAPGPAQPLEQLQAPAADGEPSVRVGPNGDMAVHGAPSRQVWASSSKDSEGRPLLKPRQPAQIEDAEAYLTALGSPASRKTHVGTAAQHPAFADGDSIVAYTTNPHAYRFMIDQLLAMGTGPKVTPLRKATIEVDGEMTSVTPVRIDVEDPTVIPVAWEMLSEIDEGVVERIAYTDQAIPGATRAHEYHAVDRTLHHVTFHGPEADGPGIVPVWTDRPAASDRGAPEPTMSAAQHGGFNWGGALPIDDPNRTVTIEPGIMPEDPLDGAAIRITDQEGNDRSPSEAYLVPGPGGLRLTYETPPVPAPRLHRSGGGLAIDLPPAGDSVVDPELYDQVMATTARAGLSITEVKLA